MYNKKLELLKEELEITMVHAEDILNEYIDTVIKQEMFNIFNKMSDEEKLKLIFTHIDNESFDGVNNGSCDCDEDIPDAFEKNMSELYKLIRYT